ncbi:hypothetical protein OPV22_020035 [Ensete ventricosum]|uniref:Uncharacterized protein n=1 Tax=Ensete ventricosum TaxID=4639 RepID=A0AAV8QP42_ENSVE|nr:hypothetical protein OPV22_020035 [Ensete ventricosum]
MAVRPPSRGRDEHRGPPPLLSFSAADLFLVLVYRGSEDPSLSLSLARVPFLRDSTRSPIASRLLALDFLASHPRRISKGAGGWGGVEKESYGELDRLSCAIIEKEPCYLISFFFSF